MLPTSPSPIHNTKMRGFSIMSKSIYTFYVYAYIRSKDSSTAKAGTPYYIGKGKGRRMYEKHGNHIAIPKDNRYIVILESNLSNTGALALERRYIRWYGRVDNRTGILRNLTDGGEGTGGYIVSEETKQKISKATKGRKHSEESKQKMCEVQKNRSKKTKQKIREAREGKTHSAETKEKMSKTHKNRSKKTCPHCGKTLDSANYGRWHGDKCKSNYLI